MGMSTMLQLSRCTNVIKPLVKIATARSGSLLCLYTLCCTYHTQIHYTKARCIQQNCGETGKALGMNGHTKTSLKRKPKKHTRVVSSIRRQLESCILSTWNLGRKVELRFPGFWIIHFARRNFNSLIWKAQELLSESSSNWWALCIRHILTLAQWHVLIDCLSIQNYLNEVKNSRLN